MPRLRTGWEPDAPEDDTILRQALLNFTDFNVGTAQALGARVRRTDELALADTGKAVGYKNNATVLRPVEAERFGELISEFEAWFAGGAGQVDLWSAWPTPDLSARGFELGGHPPLMFRAAGADARAAPPELEIRPVTTDDELAAFEHVLSTAFGAGGGPRAFDTRVLGVEDVRLWIGTVNATPVATAGVCTTRGVNGVQVIATLPEQRGRGYGEAMTWTAAQADPRRPAVLLASDLGRGVYERMGFAPLMRFTYWRYPRG